MHNTRTWLIYNRMQIVKRIMCLLLVSDSSSKPTHYHMLNSLYNSLLFVCTRYLYNTCITSNYHSSMCCYSFLLITQRWDLIIVNFLAYNIRVKSPLLLAGNLLYRYVYDSN